MRSLVGAQRVCKQLALFFSVHLSFYIFAGKTERGRKTLFFFSLGKIVINDDDAMINESNFCILKERGKTFFFSNSFTHWAIIYTQALNKPQQKVYTRQKKIRVYYIPESL